MLELGDICVIRRVGYGNCFEMSMRSGSDEFQRHVCRNYRKVGNMIRHV